MKRISAYEHHPEFNLIGNPFRRFESGETQARLAQYSYNELPEKPVNPSLKLLTYFNGPIPWMIEAAAILSALVKHWPGFFIIHTCTTECVISYSRPQRMKMEAYPFSPNPNFRRRHK